MKPTDTLTTGQIEKLTSFSGNSVRKWIRLEMLKAHMIGVGKYKHRRVVVRDLIDFLNKHEVPLPRELVNAVRGVFKQETTSAGAEGVQGDVPS